MNSIRPFLSVLAVVIATIAITSCDKSMPVKKDAVALGSCRTLTFDKGQVSICYNKLLNESRCPVGGQCVWQGMAVGQFSFVEGGNTHILTLSTLKFGPYDSDTIIGNYRIELQDITPYPGKKNDWAAGALVHITKQ